MSRWLSSVFLLLVVCANLAFGELPLENPEVRRIGEKLTCQCGCGYSLSSCQMNECSFANRARPQLLRMVKAGMSEKAILAEFQREYGTKVLMEPPDKGFFILGWLMPVLGVVFGLGVVGFLLRRYLPPRPAAESATAGDGELDRYKDRIDKDLADLD